ncbi:LCP family protein [Arthrobacter sp. UM1]|uniref:LCP family protein n=1 Tax=Arthrobacter sp. UM1 TaxID=2766776 RepID=UPI001CF6E5A9|nr:LCP family protein [Arthrobacter sp. UM1]MCB4207540.1 LCP family protein [Arthrobacter sp. UM1]
MDSRERSAAPEALGRRARRYRRQAVERSQSAVSRARLRRRGLWAVSCALVLALIAGAGLVGRLRSNFRTAPLTLGQNAQPVGQGGPLDILLLGTDTRSGANGKYGGAQFTAGQGHSDVMMLLHVSQDRKRVTVVSFPRDTLVPLPACTDPATKKTYPAQDLAMLNYALSYGGPGCTVAAVNELTGLNIDHFMMADFNAVKEISNAVGGVDVCLNSAVKDPQSGLDLPAGISTVKGDQALSFLRTRHGFADGGDIGRIRAQQAFMASLTRKVKGEGTLSDVPKLYGIADVMTQNLTVDEGLSDIPTLISVAKNMNDAQLGNIAFVTLPTTTYAPDPNRLAVDQPKAQRLFSILRRDGDVTAKPAAPSPKAPSRPSQGGTPGRSASEQTAAPAPAPSPTQAAEEDPAASVDPSLVPLAVTDASGRAGRSRAVEAQLKRLGWPLALDTGKAPSPVPTTQILYSDGYEQAAKALAAKLKVQDAQLVRTGAVEGLEVVVGQDFQQGGTVGSSGQSVSGGLSGQTADQVTCQQGNPSE